jgi:hypothetical protein
MQFRSRARVSREMPKGKSFDLPTQFKGNLRGRSLFLRQIGILLWKQYVLMVSVYAYAYASCISH